MTTGLTAAVMAAAMCVTRVEAQEKRPTAQEVIAAIQEHVGVPWKTETVDTFKAGNPETRVTGIAVTMMATLDVLQRAAAKGDKRLSTPVFRTVGNPETKVTRLAFSPGAAGFEWETHALEMENVEVLLVGETREWETVEYAADAATEGKRKGLMVIGHVPSEQ